MSEHLSALALDELAAGLENGAASAHLQSCSACQQRLTGVRAAQAALRAGPDFSARRAAWLQHAAPGPAELRARRAWARPAVWVGALAAMALVVVLWPHGDDSRLKGAVTVELLSSEGQPVQRARAGTVLTLAVGGAGHTQAGVLALDAEGKVSTLWPAGLQSASIARGARVPLSPPLQVTPGPVRVFAFFGDGPFALKPLADSLEARAGEELKTHRSVLELSAPPGAATVRLEVDP